MNEENQNVGMRIWGVTTPSLRERTQNFLNFAQTSKEVKNSEAITASDEAKQKYFTTKLNTTDHWVATACGRMTRLMQSADWINEFWYDWKMADAAKNDTYNFVQSYLTENQDNDYWKYMYNYIGDDSNTDCNPTILYDYLWWPESKKNAVEPTATPEDVEVEEDSILKKWGKTWLDMAWGTLETMLWPTKLLEKGLFKWAELTWKLFGDDEADAAAEEWYQMQKDFIDNGMVLGDKESDVWQATNMATDLATTVTLTALAPEVSGAKWAELATKYPKIAKLIKMVWWVEKLAEKYPKRGWRLKSILKGSKFGVELEAINNALDWELPTKWELLWGLIFWAWTELWLNSNFAKKAAAWLQTEWLMTPSKMRDIITKIRWRINIVPTEEELAEFMTKYWLTGTREQIVRKATELYKSAMSAVDGIFEKVVQPVYSKETTEAIMWMLKRIEDRIAKWTPASGYAQEIMKLQKLLRMDNMYSATEIEAVKRLIDKELEIFTKPGAIRDGYEWWEAARKIIQKQLEKLWEPFWDVAWLNNIVQISNWIINAIKDSSPKELSHLTAKYWLPVAASIPMVYNILQWDYKWAIWNGLLAVIWGNTALKTHLWSLMNRMRGINKTTAKEMLTDLWKSALSESQIEELASLMRWDWKIQAFLKDWVTNFIKDWLILGETALTQNGKWVINANRF